MNPVETFTAVVVALSPLFLALFTWLTRRGLETRAAEETALDKRLAQQRDDFNAVIEPLKDSITRLREDNDKLTERVNDLDMRLDDAEGLNRELVYDFKRTLDHLDREYNDPGPRRGARVNEVLGYTT
jgi:hypothetical protein